MLFTLVHVEISSSGWGWFVMLFVQTPKAPNKVNMFFKYQQGKYQIGEQMNIIPFQRTNRQVQYITSL